MDGKCEMSFWRTTLREDARVDVQSYEEIWSELCIKIVGEHSVTSGPEHDHRNILRLDADPRVSDTTKHTGTEPLWKPRITAALSQSYKLHSNADTIREMAFFTKYMLQEHIRACCSKRQEDRMKAWKQKHGHRRANRDLMPVNASYDRIQGVLGGRVRKRTAVSCY